ncbi:metallo-beta-lactamase domain protein [Acetobacteraceae bacterium AT-5844]|nr:metallo-beta-lactamase domain protein [Acetobacteraceae bacterium AT-5844]
MAASKREFGVYTVMHLRDGIFEPSSDVVIHARGDAARQAVLDRLGPQLHLEVNCFLLRGPDGVALIDAGTGDHWGAALGQARAALKAAGVAPEQVARVLLTHLHGDHALGLLEGDAAWLPRAEILVPEADLRFFTDPAAREALPEAKRGAFGITERVLRAYEGRVRPIPNGPVAAFPGIEAIPLPGHTPGHTGYLLRGGTQDLLIWGDALHLFTEQAADPETGLAYDIDPALAIRTRQDMLARAAREGWMVAGAHVPGFGVLEAAGSGYRVLPA